MSKYTSSPWQAEDKTPGCGGFFIFSGSRYIGFIGDSDLKTDSGANARLAAAPELLEALEKLALETSGRGMTANQYEALISARAAIAKAKGE